MQLWQVSWVKLVYYYKFNLIIKSELELEQKMEHSKNKYNKLKDWHFH